MPPEPQRLPSVLVILIANGRLRHVAQRRSWRRHPEVVGLTGATQMLEAHAQHSTQKPAGNSQRPRYSKTLELHLVQLQMLTRFPNSSANPQYSTHDLPSDPSKPCSGWRASTPCSGTIRSSQVVYHEVKLRTTLISYIMETERF
jgi:hypothetical protein